MYPLFHKIYQEVEKMEDIKIVVDPGHGGTDPGAVANGVKEKDLTLMISKYMYERLNELGIPVYITRDSDITLSPSERVSRILNAFGNNENVIVISNHINSNATPNSAEGAEVIYALRNDGTLANNSQRSIPKTTAMVRTGLLDIDRYKQAVDVITGEEFERETTEETDSIRIAALQELGFAEEDAISLMSDYNAWLIRPEIMGENSIAEGAESVGHQIEKRYGYYGKTAPWKVSDLELVGGSDQMNTVFSWGTLNSSGVITEAGTETIH